MAKRKKTPEGASEVTSGDKEEGFDDRLARLEALVADLEGGELGLEDAMERFGEGVKLLGAAERHSRHMKSGSKSSQQKQKQASLSSAGRTSRNDRLGGGVHRESRGLDK